MKNMLRKIRRDEKLLKKKSQSLPQGEPEKTASLSNLATSSCIANSTGGAQPGLLVFKKTNDGGGECDLVTRNNTIAQSSHLPCFQLAA